MTKPGKSMVLTMLVAMVVSVAAFSSATLKSGNVQQVFATSTTPSCGTVTYEKSSDFEDSIVKIDFRSSDYEITVSGKAGWDVEHVWLDVSGDGHSGYYLYANSGLNKYNPPGDVINHVKVELSKECQKIDWCHCEPNGNCQTLNLPEQSLINAGHMNASGNPLHAGDHAGKCVAPSPTPSPSTSCTPSPSPSASPSPTPSVSPSPTPSVSPSPTPSVSPSPSPSTSPTPTPPICNESYSCGQCLAYEETQDVCSSRMQSYCSEFYGCGNDNDGGQWLCDCNNSTPTPTPTPTIDPSPTPTPTATPTTSGNSSDSYFKFYCDGEFDVAMGLYEDGKPVKGREVTFTYMGEKKTANSNDQGRAQVSFAYKGDNQINMEAKDFGGRLESVKKESCENRQSSNSGVGGQVLGASTMAGTGVVTDILANLSGILGLGMSLVGLKRYGKKE